MKKVVVLSASLFILFLIAFACDYEGVLCGGTEENTTAKGDTSKAEKRY